MSTEFETLAYARLAGDDEVYARAAREGRAHGYAEGYAEGARRAERELAERAGRLEADHAARQRDIAASAARQTALLDWVIDALDMRVTPVLESARGALLAGSVDLAEALLGLELADADRSARGIAARVLAELGPDVTVTRIRVNPAEVAAVAALVGERREIAVVGDAAVDRGDAVAELPDGFLDARIGSAVARVRAALTDLRGPAHGEAVKGDPA